MPGILFSSLPLQVVKNTVSQICVRIHKSVASEVDRFWEEVSSHFSAH